MPESSTTESSTTNPIFTYRIIIQPLGLLYGSKGRFLSPENLVGRSGSHFPPDTPTLSGLFAQHYKGDRAILDPLMLAGPFWAKQEATQNFYVPTPFHCWVQGELVTHLKVWRDRQWQLEPLKPQDSETGETNNAKKRQFGTWIAIGDWDKVRSPTHTMHVPVEFGPWEAIPHLHPRLQPCERRSVGSDNEQGSLFLEYGIQVDPEACLVYLANEGLPEGCYRFGGEGHLVQVTSEPIEPDEPIGQLLQEDLGHSFATICPSVWGSTRMSYRGPLRHKDTGAISWPDNPVEALLTQRPVPFRFRLGDQKDDQNTSIQKRHDPKMLSRGRYAVPAGSVYVMAKSLCGWRDWKSGKRQDESWFPYEGYSFKRWGCGLSLPLDIALA